MINKVKKFITDPKTNTSTKLHKNYKKSKKASLKITQIESLGNMGIRQYHNSRHILQV